MINGGSYLQPSFSCPTDFQTSGREPQAIYQSHFFGTALTAWSSDTDER